jgi:hypothetical protein
VASSCEHGDESSGSGAKELVSLNGHYETNERLGFHLFLWLHTEDSRYLACACIFILALNVTSKEA